MTGMHRIDRIKIIKNILYIRLIHVKNQPGLNYARKVSQSCESNRSRYRGAGYCIYLCNEGA